MPAVHGSCFGNPFFPIYDSLETFPASAPFAHAPQVRKLPQPPQRIKGNIIAGRVGAIANQRVWVYKARREAGSSSAW